MNARTEPQFLARLSNSHLDALEEETIFILREVAAAFERPALLFSGGKDSLVMLRCAEKAFGTGHIPYNPLHDEFFPSIGCAPCTRAVTLGEDFRSGRWWWEQESAKECGLHVAADGTHEAQEPAAFEQPVSSHLSRPGSSIIPIREIPV